jgi:hypothetical protein
VHGLSDWDAHYSVSFEGKEVRKWIRLRE